VHKEYSKTCYGDQLSKDECTGFTKYYLSLRPFFTVILLNPPSIG